MSIQMVDELKKYGLRVQAYKRAPVHRDIFAMTIAPRHKEGVILVNQGRALVDVVGDKKLRQAAVTVRERGRKITKRVRATWSNMQKPDADQAALKLKTSFPIIMPATAEWKVDAVVIKRIPGRPGYSNTYWKLSGTVTAAVKDTTVNHFLLGMDETRQFIAPIKHEVTSVKEAHRILRPQKRLPFGTFRQGEWFFLPCGEVMTKRLDRLVSKNRSVVRGRRLGNTTHLAKTSINHRDIIYARGYIMDDRFGHHKPIFLPTWHKVVKNKEAKIHVSKDQEELVLKRARTWD